MVTACMFFMVSYRFLGISKVSSAGAAMYRLQSVNQKYLSINNSVNIDWHTPFDPVVINPLPIIHTHARRDTVQVIYQTGLAKEFIAER